MPLIICSRDSSLSGKVSKGVSTAWQKEENDRTPISNDVAPHVIEAFPQEKAGTAFFVRRVRFLVRSYYACLLEHVHFENAPGVERSETPPRSRSSRNSLAAYSSGGGVKPAGQNIGSGRQLCSNAICSDIERTLFSIPRSSGTSAGPDPPAPEALPRSGPPEDFPARGLLPLRQARTASSENLRF